MRCLHQGDAGRKDVCGRSGRRGIDGRDRALPDLRGKLHAARGKDVRRVQKKTEYEEEETEDPEKDDAWRTYLDDDADDLGIPLPEGEFDDDEDEEEEEDEEEGEEKARMILNTSPRMIIIPTMTTRMTMTTTILLTTMTRPRPVRAERRAAATTIFKVMPGGESVNRLKFLKV